MAAGSKNLLLQLVISAKDNASSALAKFFSGLNDSTNVVMSKIRETLSGLFGGGLDGAKEFESALSAVAAKGGYTADEMATLKQAAIDIGAKFGVSGAQAAKGMEALAAAGLNATQVMQALPSVLALAKAENVSMNVAAERLSDSLSAVGLGFNQAGRMADVLAKGANISTTSAIALSEALANVGGISLTAGLSLEQTVGALSALANAGIKGSEAGTALSAILTALVNPSSQASKELSALGITSRNLSDVIGGLAAKSDAAGPAILAFGETAGPGLRALIKKGQEGIDGLSRDLLSAQGAAEEAATKINANLVGALSALDAAWTNIKSALAEPVLKPLADAARDAASALNDALSKGALKPAQEAIQAFTVNAVQAARDFIAGFDFKGAITAVQSLASSAKESFASIQSAGQTAADVVSIAWNSLSAGVKTIGAALLAVASSAVSNLALVEEAASKIGLGSIERAKALQQTANDLAAKASALTDSIAKNGESIKSAFDRLTTSSSGAADGINRVADAQQRLKDSAPAVEIQNISRSLDDLKSMAFQADVALKAAQQGFWAGTASLNDLSKAADASAQAHDDLAAGQDAAAKAAAVAAPAHKATAVELQAVATSAEDAAKRQASYTSALQGAGDAQADALRAEIALARAKGDSVTVATKSIELARLEADMAVKVAASKQAEAKALADQVAAQRAYLASINGGTAAQQQELQTMQLKLAAMQAEAVAAQANIEIRERERKTAESMAQGLAVLIDGYRREAETLQNNIQTLNTIADARERSAKAALTVAQASGDQQQIDKAQAELNQTLIEGGYQRAQAAQLTAKGDQDRATQAALAAVADGKYTLAEMDAVNALQDRADASQKAAAASYNEATANEASIKAAQRAAEAQRHLTDDGGAFAAVLASQIQYWRDQTDALSKATKALFEFYAGFSSVDPRLGGKLFGGMTEEAAAAKSKIAELTTYIRSMQDATILAASDISVMFADINAAGAAAQKTYYEQKLAAEELESKLQDLGENGARSFGSIAAAQQFVNGQARAALDQFNLLNDQDLSRLKDGISKAKDELKALQDEAQSAKDRIAELNAQIAAERGDTAASDKMKLALEEEQALREANLKLQEAQSAGDRETIALYEEQIRKINELYGLKEKNLTAQAAPTATPTASTATPTASTAGLNASKVLGTYQLDLTANGKKLTATTATDPAAFFSELETSRLRTT